MTRALAWSLWTVAIAFGLIGTALLLLTPDAPVPDQWGFRGFWVVAAPLVATPGLLIALRQPGNAIGWIVLVGGVSNGFGGFAQEYVTYGVLAHPGALPAVGAVAWIGSWSWSLSAGPMITLVPQLFPTGRPLTPRWRPLVAAGALFVPFAFVIFGLRPGPLENAAAIANPLAATGALEDFRRAFEPPASLAMLVSGLASGFALVFRFRRARGVERQQLKWMAVSATLIALAFSAVVVSNQSKPAQIAMVAAFMTMPAAMAVAILRHRLYDIDVVINRALVYVAVSAVLGATYAAAVVVFQALLRPLTGGSELAIAMSTLVVAALFQPVRRRAQEIVDRRFYRSRYDAARTLDAFTARLRDQVELESVRSDLLGVVRETIRPAHASVWLRRVPR